MNPNVPGIDEQSVHKDAMFFSMHKFIGGVQTPGKEYYPGDRLHSESSKPSCGTACRVSSDREKRVLAGKLNDPGKNGKSPVIS